MFYILYNYLYTFPYNYHIFITGTAVSITDAMRIISDLRTLDHAQVGNKGFDRDTWAKTIDPLVLLWKTVGSSHSSGNSGRSGSGRPLVQLQSPPDQWTPIEAFLSLEMQTAIAMANTVDSILDGLTRVLSGTGLLTQQLHTCGSSLLAGNVPDIWLKPPGVPNASWYPSSPTVYLKTVAKRFHHLCDMIGYVNQKGVSHFLSRPLPLNSVFRPKTLLNALRQQTARAIKQPIDSLRLCAAWDASLFTDKQGKFKTLPLPVTSILIQGAALSLPRTKEEPPVLVDVAKGSGAIESVSDFYLAFIGSNDPDPYGSVPVAPVPVYSDPSRETLVCEIKVPISGKLPKWILAGVAMFLSGDQ